MSRKHESIEDRYEKGFYEIRIKGHLDDKWVDRFEGMNFTLEENGYTLITGLIVDQAALYGLLKKVRDLGLSLISVSPVEPGSQAKPGTNKVEAPDDRL